MRHEHREHGWVGDGLTFIVLALTYAWVLVSLFF